MKNSFKKLLVTFALVMTFIMVHTAWSGIEDVGEITEVTGVVYECEPGSGFQVDTGEEIISVYSMGPPRYWEVKGVDFPQVGDEVTIWAFEITFSDGTTKLVAKEVDLGADGSVDIVLRDDDGTPLWRQRGKRLNKANE